MSNFIRFQSRIWQKAMITDVFFRSELSSNSECNTSHESMEYIRQSLLPACFVAWRLYSQRKKNGNEKLNNFINLLKKYQNQQHPPKVMKKNEPRNEFRNRFKAQEEIIKVQKVKLIHQEKMIEQLKLGNLCDAINESVKKTNTDIREIFGNCSTKLKCKLKSSLLLDEGLHFAINSNKAPKIIREIEQRALERERKRRLIREKKRVIDETKRRAIEEDLAQKRTQDEEERQRSMEAMRKRRKAQLEFHRVVKAKREKYMKDCVRADLFYRSLLKKVTLRTLKNLLVTKRDNMFMSGQFYEDTLRRNAMKCWRKFVEAINCKKNEKAANLYNFKAKTAAFRSWLQLHIAGIQRRQVAEDFYLMQLEKRIFHQFHRYTCVQYMLQIKNMRRAESHYNSRIRLHYFYQWKSYPAIMVIERAKEEKKRKWREKVWEVLPNYQPVLDTSF
ncbi:coiled-coil domain-containing protein 191-like [Photinus pyralis]|uniref:coiled-coil domain-containing protein 191-like n=1 Tax=Photinus pyralis TaxID=7054 RepID=UPI001266FF2A|nr:coiled-coil domain-containing protein 191-like [Photinus pyralis]